MPEILRYAAFSDRPEGGNPAGVVLHAEGLDEVAMRAIAADLGYSETAFLQARGGTRYDVRYFSPLAEVPFCGHATIASAVALAERNGPGKLELATRSGAVAVDTSLRHGRVHAVLTSVEPSVEPAPGSLVDGVLEALAWSPAELDTALPPRIAYAGARHLVLAAATHDRLRRLRYDFDALKSLMLSHDLITVDLVWRESAVRYRARNPFPVGGVVEDAATGAAAAAFGAYLRAIGQVRPPATITVVQGEDMGRPSTLEVDIGIRGGIRVGGTAVAIRGGDPPRAERQPE